ncbi:MAG: aminopeptidase P family protein [Saprospiraceae bacterium]|nr:aminopeptidase P family protein [Saprospiraceae bacterium]
MKYDAISSTFFSRNRKRFMRKMQPDSMAVFFSNKFVYSRGDINFPYVQNEDFWYLSGVEAPETVLILFPDCLKNNHQEILFIKKHDAADYALLGPSLKPDEAANISGVKQVYWVGEFELILNELAPLSKRIYVNIPEHQNVTFASDSMGQKAQAAKLMEHYPAHKFHRSQPILRKLRAIKQAEEIALLNQAVQITEAGMKALAAAIRPGITEYELEAELTRSFLVNKAEGHAFPPIIAGGKRSCFLHYQKNNQACGAGEIILVDTGARYAHYSADITRVFPVDGIFTNRQHLIYEVVEKALQELTLGLVPGKTLDEFNEEAKQILHYNLMNVSAVLSTSTPQYYGKRTLNGPTNFSVAHHIGMTVHDTANRYEPLQAGMVICCEPGCYIYEEGIGVRLENMILITDEGPHNLSKGIPTLASEVESITGKIAIS